MSRKKISTTIYVTPEQSDRLRLLHERTKVPVAVYIREGIDLVLQHYGNMLPGQLALNVAEAPSPAPTAARSIADRGTKRLDDEESFALTPDSAPEPRGDGGEIRSGRDASGKAAVGRAK